MTAPGEGVLPLAVLCESTELLRGCILATPLESISSRSGAGSPLTFSSQSWGHKPLLPLPCQGWQAGAGG